ncbi:MAG: zf-HC2 domain-containing protein [Burkholderiales bacterium]
MRTCKEISMLLSQAQERPLGRAERWSVRLHLLLCAGCSNFRAQLELLRAAVRHYRDGG